MKKEENQFNRVNASAGDGSKGLGTAGFILGLISVLTLGLGAILALVGLILCIVQLVKNKTKLAIAGLILSIIGIILGVILVVLIVVGINFVFNNLVTSGFEDSTIADQIEFYKKCEVVSSPSWIFNVSQELFIENKTMFQYIEENNLEECFYSQNSTQEERKIIAEHVQGVILKSSS